MTDHDQGADRSADRKPREVRGELIERLNYVIDRVCDPDCEGRCKVCPREACQEAATALATQDARIKELEEALRPFADACEAVDDAALDRYEIWEAPAAMEIRVGDLRRARSTVQTEAR